MEKKPHSKLSEFNFRLVIMLLLIVPIVGYYTYMQVSGSTFFGISITTNPDLENGLVGHWTFDGDLSTQVTDSSGQGNHGYLSTNMPTTTATAIGKVGQALNFDAVDDYVTGLSPGLPNVGDSAAITISAWVKPNTLSGTDTLFNKGASGTCFNYGLVFVGGVLSARNSNNDYSLTGSVVNNIWSHVTVVFDSSGVEGYINGVSVGINGTPKTTNCVDTNWSIGQRAYNSALEFFDGTVDDVRIYDRALSAAEITRLYQLGATTHIGTTLTTNPDLETGLVGHWTFDGPDMNWSSTTAEALDRSGQGNNGNVTNFGSEGVTFGKIGQALDFDGNDDRVDFTTNFGLGASSATLATWVYLDSTSESGAFIKIGETPTGNGGYAIGVGGTTLDNNGNDLILLYEWVAWRDTNDPIGTGWHHVAMTINGTTRTAYIDGVNVDQTTATPQAPGNEAHIGGYTSGDPTNRHVDALLDDVRIYNRALSAAEITRLYQLGATTHIGTTITTNPDLESNLIGHWTFDGPDLVNNATDRSGQGNNGYLRGFTSTTTALGKIGQALQFDGNGDRMDLSSTNGFDFNGGTGSFSVGMWLKIDSLYAGGPVIIRPFQISMCTAAPSYLFMQIATTTQSVTLAAYDSNSVYGQAISANSSWSTGEWFHVLGVFDRQANEGRMYINGTQSGNTSNLSSQTGTIDCDPSTGTQTVGGSGASFSYGGLMDDVRIYDKALSADEAQRLYEMGG